MPKTPGCPQRSFSLSGYVPRLLGLAARLSRLKKDRRAFFLGAIAVRADGCIVGAYNGPVPEPSFKQHAEWRLSRKLDKGACIYIARTTSAGAWANAEPCPGCWKRLKACKARRVIFTMGPDAWGTYVLCR